MTTTTTATRNLLSDNPAERTAACHAAQGRSRA